MSYNNKSQPTALYTAGKITIVTTLLGVLVFVVAFLFNISNQEYQKVVAQSRATTSVNVLNTPPQWVLGQEGREEVESSVTNPTNSGTEIAWVGTAADSNAADYYLVVCSGTSTPAPPVPVNGGTPGCAPSTVEWAVSTATISGTLARAATTTVDRDVASQFAESNDWYAWVCDADPINARCFGTFSTGTAATNSAPFIVNSRPDFTFFDNDSPADPGAAVNFTATSSDLDTNGAADTVQLHVCFEADFGTGTSSTECGPGGFLASSTLAASDPSVIYNLPVVIADQDYAAYGYIIDNHGHQADGAIQGSNASITVNNVAPSAGSITVNAGNDIVLVNAATQTPNFTLTYIVTDNNSCLNASAGSEVVDYEVSLYRSGVGSTTCDATSGTYDPNNCYVTNVPTTTWAISCSASTTAADTCGGGTDATETWECTYPLWYITDPTDDVATATPYSTEDWRAEVKPVDDNNATGTDAESPAGAVDVLGLLAFALDTVEIPYGALEPGNNTGTLSASTTVRATGNVGIDELLEGTSMCGTYAFSTPCPTSATSTIGENNQVFGTSSIAYSTATPQFVLSSSTAKELEINIIKPQSTSTQPSAETFWGIAIPGSITLAGDYFGQNTFTVRISETGEWGI